MKANIPKELRGGSRNKRAQAAFKKAREVQKIVEEQVKELDQKEYTATSGGGVVSVVFMGMRVKSIRIDPEVVNKDDVSMLSDLITAAINEAISFAQKEKDEILDAQTSGVDLSAMLGMF